MSDQKEDKPEDRYRDDPKEFAASADSVQHRSNVIDGGGVESTAEPVSSMSRGSQEDWRPDPEAAARAAAMQAANDDGPPASGSTDAGADVEESSDDLDGGTSKVAPNNPHSPDDRER